MEYSAFNPIVWGTFIGFVALTVGIVVAFKTHQLGYPGNPGDTPARASNA